MSFLTRHLKGHTMFKNLIVFRISPEWNGTLADVQNSLDKSRFAECTPSQERSIGWVEPRGEKHAPLLESIGGQWILKAMSETKVLPGSVVKETLDERLAMHEAQTGRKPGKREKAEIKDAVRAELLTKAFSKKAATFVWINPKQRLIVIDASSKNKADEMATLLVKSIDDFGVALVNTIQSPSAAMSHWLVTQEAPNGFTADRDCALKAIDETKSSVKYAKHALDIDEIRAHITNGKVPTQLAMTWQGRVSFVLTEALNLKKIEFQDVVFSGDRDGDEGFDADVAILTGELSKMLPAVIEALGGEGEATLHDADGGSSSRTKVAANVGDEAHDELYEKAVAVVLSSNSGGISSLQRQLQIGYNRAATLLEMMERNGLVSPMRSDGSREVLASNEAAEA